MNNKKKPTTHKPQFNLKTEIRDSKGNIIRSDPYRLTINNGVREFERPPGSGFFYSEDSKLIRQPKETKAGSKEEFSNDEISKQLVDLRGKEETVQEINMTAKDVDVSDIPAVPAGEVDNSEEIALMEQAGATVQAEELKAKKYTKQNFIK